MHTDITISKQQLKKKLWRIFFTKKISQVYPLSLCLANPLHIMDLPIVPNSICGYIREKKVEMSQKIKFSDEWMKRLLSCSIISRWQEWFSLWASGFLNHHSSDSVIYPPMRARIAIRQASERSFCYSSYICHFPTTELNLFT